MNLGLDKEKRKTLIVWALIGIVVVGIIYMIKSDINPFDKDSDKVYSIVDDNQRYLTVSNIISKYYGYLGTEDKENILIILEKNYKESNNITKENLDDFVDYENKDYSSRIMCKKRLKKGYTSFLVSGFEIDSFIDETAEDKGYNDFISGNKYYEVILNETNMTFSIKPTTEVVFRGECHE